MSDTPQTQPPGWYYAQGDPPGTQRYWDGQKWEGGPQPVPGSGGDVGAMGGGAPGQVAGLAEPIARIGARVIDYLVWIAINIVFTLVFIGSFAFNAAGAEEVSFVASFLAGLLGAVAITAYETVLVGTRGQTLGKMALNLKVVRADGAPVEMKDGFMRILPYFALAVVSSLIPFFGLIAFLAFLVIGVTSLVFLFTDASRQTVWDKVAKTLVVNA